MIRLGPITALSQELVKFDTQAMQTPGREGIQYQQGDHAGYEVRELLLERWNRQCAYCDRQQIPLQVEHIQSRARGGTDRLSNLTLACKACNQAKGRQDIRVFLQDQPERLERILAHAREPLKDAAALNATRWALYERLQPSTACRDRQWMADQIQPQPASVAQNTLAGRSGSWSEHPAGLTRGAGPSPDYHGNRTRLPPDVPDGPVRLPAYLGQAGEVGTRLHHRRSGASRGKEWEKEGNLCGKRRHPLQWLL